MRGAAALVVLVSASLLIAVTTVVPRTAITAAAPTAAPATITAAAPPTVPAAPIKLAAATTPATVTPPAPPITPAAAPTAAATPTAPSPGPRRVTAPPCNNPTALGVSRTVEIDTTGGPGFGFEHFKEHEFLRDKEVILTFDDGPWPSTPAVLKALADECVLATFFPIGKHVTYHPEILRQVAAAGHTIGSHTWSHADLSRKTLDEAKDEIEKGISAVIWGLEGQYTAAPFFRFPALRHPPDVVTYLGQRNIAIFSTDMDSFDFKMRKPEQVINSVMTRIKKRGKGIILMHDFQHATSLAVPEILAQLKAGGFKIVHMRAHDVVTSLPQYDEEFRKSQTFIPTVSQRPTSSIVKTVQ